METCHALFKKKVVFTGKRGYQRIPVKKKYRSTVDTFTDEICKLIYSE